LKGIEVMMSSYTRLLLGVERREGVWRLFGFDPVYLRDEIDIMTTVHAAASLEAAA
jgi:hypothetical protein